MIFRFIVLFILVLATSNIYAHAFSSNDTDHQALLSIKASIKGDTLGVLTSWNNSVHFCQWNGVACRRQRVTALNLSSQHLVGTLSPHIGNLSFLRSVNIRQNDFHGLIPNEIGRLLLLQYLDLGLNYFEGGLPNNLSHFVNIKSINLDNNNLKGILPTEFCSWPKLNTFNLAKNHFTGSVPPSIGNISSLSELDLGYNNLGGKIPLEIAHHTKLDILKLNDNNFWGMVSHLLNISSLYHVRISFNTLQGTLPADLAFTLPKLQTFVAAVNRFSGPLPPSIVNASDIVLFEISRNNITGPILNNLGSLPSLQVLSLNENPLGESQRPGELAFFNSLVNSTNLKELGLAKCGLRGKLPSSVVNLSTTMEYLFLYENYLYGSIPREIGKLVNLVVLELSRNFLTGDIPESIGELHKLQGLDLGFNNISGLIATSISNITQLVSLILQHNMLQGSIPAGFFDIPTLQHLYLGGNSLGGVIPDKIVYASQLIDLNLARNLFTGNLPSNIGSLKHLVLLDISYNKLKGDITATLGDCVMLAELFMQGNLFDGKIPNSLEALQSLVFLDLSNNNMSGSIPIFLSTFNLIKFLNLSNNNFEGEVHKEGLFSNVSAFSVAGNSRLCGGIKSLHLPACSVKVSRSKEKTTSQRKILLVIIPLGILLACVALICYQSRNSNQLNDPVPVLQDNQYLRLSYQELVLATNEFSPHNLLGEGRYGSVYKGVLDSVEHVVAVKVLNVQVRGANKSFLAECETLRNIRHRNLIKIITACSSTDFKGNDFKALVFEFMTNGCLDSWLHPSPSYQGNKRNLTLLQRLSISIDVALGVDYLHNHSHESIIHCDIKPSNILLDDDLVAHIGDFGLARFSFTSTGDIHQAQMSSTGVHGTVGYVPPEYGVCGEISTEGDVYSYGILLLELFSGKPPTEISVFMGSGNNLHDYVRKALPQRVMDIVDQRVVLDEREYGLTENQSYSRATMEECLASIFEVGILCSEENPKKRIAINVAIKQLHVAREKLLKCR